MRVNNFLAQKMVMILNILTEMESEDKKLD